MDAILQKIKADIGSRPLISGLIVVTIVTSATLLTLALATLMNLSAPYDTTFEELNAAHVWLHFNKDRLGQRDVERIEALPGILESTGLRYSVLSRVHVRDTQVWTSLRAIPPRQPAVNRLLVQEGRYLSPGQDELLVSRDLDYLYQVPVGEPIGIVRADGKEVELPVIGLAYDPMWDIYRNSQPPYIYLSEATLRELFPNRSTWDWSMGLRLADPNAVDEVVTSIEAMLHSTEAIESYTDWREVRESAMFEVQLNLVLLGAFSFFTVLAAILVIASSISAMVLSQFKQIGILKAVGFTQGQILWLYLGQYLALSLIGSPLGLLLGIALSPLPLRSAAVSLSTTFRPPVEPLLITLVLTVVPAIAVLATLGSARRGAKAIIVKAITTGAEAPRRKPSWVERLAAWLRLPVVLILGLNDVFARPFRSFLTGLNLTLGVIGIVFGLTLNETIVTYREDPTLLGIPYDAVVTREETSDVQTRHKLRRATGVEAFYGECLVNGETEKGQAFLVRAVEGELAAFPFQISEGRLPHPDAYEAMAGQGLLDWLGLAVGDEITLVLEEEEHRPVTWRIVGQYSEPSNAGQMLVVNLFTAKRALRHIEPRTYYLKLRPGVRTAQLKRELQPQSDADLSLTFVGRDVPDTIYYLQLAILALSVILIGVALINVFNTSLVAVQEKLKAIGILKTVGMTPSQVMAMVNTTAGFLGLVAALIGSPLGLAAAQGTLAVLSRVYGFGGVRVSLDPSHVLLLIPLIVVISMAGSFVPGWWATKVSIVQVIRSE